MPHNQRMERSWPFSLCNIVMEMTTVRFPEQRADAARPATPLIRAVSQTRVKAQQICGLRVRLRTEGGGE